MSQCSNSLRKDCKMVRLFRGMSRIMIGAMVLSVTCSTCLAAPDFVLRCDNLSEATDTIIIAVDSTHKSVLLGEDNVRVGEYNERGWYVDGRTSRYKEKPNDNEDPPRECEHITVEKVTINDKSIYFSFKDIITKACAWCVAGVGAHCNSIKADTEMKNYTCDINKFTGIASCRFGKDRGKYQCEISRPRIP